MRPVRWPPFPHDGDVVFGSKAEGKGAGGLRGLAPWRSMRQRLMRACGAPPPPHTLRSLPDFPPLLRNCFLSDCLSRPYRHASIRTLLWLPPRCPLVFSIREVLLSQHRSVGPQSPVARRSPATSQSPQLGAFAYLADSRSFASSFLPCPYWLYAAASAFPFPFAFAASAAFRLYCGSYTSPVAHR